MKTILKDLRDMLTSGDNNKISSKRLITFLAFILVSISFFANLFFGKTLDVNIFEGLINIVWVGMGVVVGEHLLKTKNGEKAPKPTEGENIEVPEDQLGDN